MASSAIRPIIFLALVPLLAAGPLNFEVASVKKSTSGRNGVQGGCHGIDSKYGAAELAAAPPLGRCVITDGRLSHLIGMAYGVSMAMIQNAPDWVIAGADRFNVEAKAEDPAHTTEAQLHEMLQALLAERFQLKFHRENRDMAGFAIVIGKNGPRLREAKGDEVGLFGNGGKPRPGEPISLKLRGFSMPQLAALLSQIGPGPMADKTGLTGEYDFDLTWDESSGPSLFTALQEQLGLKLEPRKVPVMFFVFDSAERPGDN
jgi:uncharacterized protein (TIGR03435 family)